MYRQLLVVCFFSLSYSVSYAQDINKYLRDSSDLIKVKDLNIRLGEINKSELNRRLPFRSIKVFDVRYDTSLIGTYAQFTNLFVPSITNSKLTLEGGVKRSFENRLNDRFKNYFDGDDSELICFITQFRILSRDSLNEAEGLGQNVGQLKVKIEAFLKTQDDYTAAFKVDTIFTEYLKVLSKREVTTEIRENLIVPTVEHLFDVVIKTEWEKVLKRKLFSQGLVFDNYFNKRFGIPILVRPPVKGIYRTFKEFKNNTPSIQDFSVKKEKFKTVSLIDRNGDYINTTKTFGFSDGSRCWIQNGNFSYPLLRSGNSFLFFITIIQNIKVLASIDMEDGDVL